MEQQFSTVFWKIYDAAKQHPRYISNRGGARSGKTYSILQFLHLLISKADKAGDVTSVVSETVPHLKRGAMRDFERILGHPLRVDPNWNASDYIYTYPNGARLEFFSADSPGKVLGPARKRLFVNECNNISYEVFVQLAMRTTGIIFLDYNPAAVFWCIEQVETRPNCVTIVSTYKDNEFLSKEQVEEIEALKDNPALWRVYGRGEIGSLEGRIYKDFTLIDEMPSGDEAQNLTEVYGMDFGFTNDPTTLLRLLVDTKRKRVYVDQRLYRKGMKNPDIAAFFRQDGLTRLSTVYADCAEPKSIAEINDEGFNVVACSKDAPTRSEKLQFQLLWMQGWTYFVTKTSLETIRESRNYCWAKDKDGKALNYPNDKGEHFDHCLDALRYALWSHFGENAGTGEYTIHIGKRYGIRHH